MLHCIILGILTVGAKGFIVNKLKETYNHTITEEELRDRIPEPSITLLKPRGFTVSIPGFLDEYIKAIDLAGGINLFPPGVEKEYNISYPIFEDLKKIKSSSWFCEVKDVEVKAGDKIEYFIRAYYNVGPIFEDAKKYFCYNVTEEEIKKLNVEVVH